jgi:SAM-dependent methyltransferase
MTKQVEVIPADATARGYDRWADRYDGGGNPMIAASEWVMDRVPLAVQGARVIELGCGTGRNARRVLDGGAVAYLGVDGSSGMLARAVQAPGASWLCAPLEEVRVAGFDVALIVLVLEHVASLAPVFAAARRALRDGGVLRVIEIHPSLVAAGTVAHFEEGEREVRFASDTHAIDEVRAALADFDVLRVDEHEASGSLLAAVPALAKHQGKRVMYDLAAAARGESGKRATKSR